MKKLLILAAAAALLLVSCAKVETTQISENTGNIPVAFSNYVPRSITKATSSLVDAAVLTNGTHFGVYAWAQPYTGENPTPLTANPGTPAFMSDVDVTYGGDTGSGAANAYSPKRYWPAGDKPDYLSFIAYYPYQGAGITAPTFATGVGTYAFAAQSTSATMIDFMVADVVNDQLYGATNKYNTTHDADHKGTVQFTFKHQLAKVQFMFKKKAGLDATTVIELVDAKLNKIQTTGTLAATYNASTHATTTTWSNQAIAATPIVYDVTLDQANPESGSEIVLEETVNTVHQDDIFLMVPQTMFANSNANAQYLEVTWNVKVYDTDAHAATNDGTGLISTTTNSKKLYLDDCVQNDGETAANIDWAKNNVINYTITIGPNPILFTATVTEWDDTAQNGYFIVN